MPRLFVRHWKTLFVYFFAIASIRIFGATPEITWGFGPPTLTGIASGDSGFVAVGSGGEIAYSPDEQTWLDAGLTNNVPLAGVAFGSGLYVAVGQAGTILSSPDGVTWTSRDATVSTDLNAIIFANGRFIVVGNEGTIVSSTDGRTWNHQTSSAPANSHLRAVTFGNGTFAAGGTLGTLVTSTDGQTWKFAFTGVANTIGGLAYGNGTFVATLDSISSPNNVLTSANGEDWTQQHTGIFSVINGVAFGSGRFVMVGGGSISASSADGQTWTTKDGDGFTALNTIIFARNKFYSAGERGKIQSSSDGANWTAITGAMRGEIGGITYGNNLFVAVGNNSNGSTGIQTSKDGLLWKLQTAPGSNRLDNVIYGKDQFLAVGSDRFGAKGTLMTSPDGSQWTEQPLPSGGNYLFTGAAYGNGKYILVGKNIGQSGGVIFTSDDGSHWTDHTPDDFPPLSELGNVAFVNNQFVAVGSGSIVTSSDGNQWTQQFQDNRFVFTDVAYGNKTFVVVGQNPFATKRGITVTSKDGTNWTLGSADTYDTIDTVSFARGFFYAGGLASNPTHAGILVSADGLAWTYMTTPSLASELLDIASSNQKIVAVGGNGTIVSALLPPPPPLPAFGQFSYNTSAPIRSGKPWQFTAVLASEVSDLHVRVQSTLTPNVESSWTDLPGGAFMGRLDSTWTLNTTEIPAGTRYFRAIASAPDYADSKSIPIGPIEVQSGLSPFGTFSYETTAPLRTGAQWKFSITEKDLVSDLRVRVQSSTDPNNEASWTDLPGNPYMGHLDSNWSLITETVPTGTRYFRIIASAPTYGDLKSAILGPLTVTDPKPTVSQTFTGNRKTYSLESIPEVQDPAVVLMEAISQATIYFVLDPLKAIEAINAAIVVYAEQTAAASLTVGAGQTLQTPGANIGPNASLVLKGTIDGAVNLIGSDSAGLIGNDGAGLIGHDSASLQAISSSGALASTAPLISSDSASLIGNDSAGLGGNQEAASLIGNDGASLIGNDGAGLIGSDSAGLIGNDGAGFAGPQAASVNPAVAVLASRSKASASNSQSSAVNSVIGPMTVNGDYTQSSNGALAIALAGTNQYDQLIVSGTARLSGVLGFGLFDSNGGTNSATAFQPPFGTFYDVVVADKVFVSDLTVRGPIWGNGLNFLFAVVQRTDGKQALRLLAYPVPPPLAIQKAQDQLEVFFPVNYTGYAIQRSTDLTSGVWTTVTTNTNRLSISVAGTDKAAFFKVVKQQ